MNETSDRWHIDPLPTNPLPLFIDWFEAARKQSTLPNPDAMTLATADASGKPSARIVLCKGIVADPGYLVFYTNYASRKGRSLEENAAVAATFHWDALDRQVRVEGIAVRAPGSDSDAYFGSRDRESQLGAWASRQSSPVDSRADLLQAMTDARRRFNGAAVPRPPHWGGYRIWIHTLELWSRGDARLHDRICWTRQLMLQAATGEFTLGPWAADRLQP